MPDEFSKSALKREAERLQKIGLKLTQLKPDIRARLQLSDALREAIDVHAGITEVSVQRFYLLEGEQARLNVPLEHIDILASPSP